MPRSRRKRLVCFHCAVPMVKADRDHYGYQCHACVVREHELVLLSVREPNHPDVVWLDGVPVDIGRAVTPKP